MMYWLYQQISYQSLWWHDEKAALKMLTDKEEVTIHHIKRKGKVVNVAYSELKTGISECGK